jgi:signal transduction histidine kinase/CheY-like chemotaxis protein
MNANLLTEFKKNFFLQSTKVLSADNKIKVKVNLLCNLSLLLVIGISITNMIVSGNWATMFQIAISSFVILWICIKLITNKLDAEIGKKLIIILVLSFIFFTDLLLGKGFGVYFYYFTFVVSFVNIFKWEKEKFETISQTLVLPIILMLSVTWIKATYFTEIKTMHFYEGSLFLFNCYASFFIIAVHTIMVVSANSKLANKNSEIELHLNTLLNNANANIRTIDTSYKVSGFNQAFKETMHRHFDVDIKNGFNIQYELFAEPDFPLELKQSYVKALCGERVNTEYIVNDEYFELMAAPLEKDGDITGVILYDRDITEKKKKEFELKQFVLDLKTLVDNTQGSIWSINNNFEVTTTNECFVSTMKTLFDVNVYVGYNMKNIFQSPKFPEKIKYHNIEVIQGNILNEEFEIDGSYFEITGRPLLNEHGNIIGATFHNFNITHRKVNEIRVEQLSLNLQSLIDNTNDSIWSIDSNYKLITGNKTYIEEFKRLFGIDVIIGFNLKNIFKHQNFDNNWEQHYKDVLNGTEVNVSYCFHNKIYRLIAKPIIKNDIVIGAAFYTSDITESFTINEKIKQSEINLQTIIDNNSGDVWGIDNNYKLLAFNESFKTELKESYGLDAETGFDMNAAFNIKNYPESYIENCKKVLAGEKVVFINDNGIKCVEIKGVQITVDNKITGAVFFSEDITLKKKYEKELILAKEKAEEVMKAKARFLSNMSHELRTPLNGVIGITNILCDEEKLESQLKHLDLLKYSSDHMYSLINDILDFSKIDEGKIVLEKTPFNLAITVDRTAVMFSAEAKKKGLEFNLHTTGIDDLSITGDVTRLRQVLNNLITNAIKFTEKGSIDFKVNKLTSKDDKKALIEFIIQDTGIGICTNKIDSIFESFTQADVDTTRRYGGTGLGLTISKKLVDIMGSKLVVNSVINKGSSFTFILELDTINNKSNIGNIDTIKKFDNLRILLAEDNKINMLVAKKQLEKWGIIVDEAENGLAALNKFNAHNYDLILMDMEMPVMDGLTSTEKIREINKEIPIMALTAASFENMNDYLREKGLNGFIKKPFNPAELNKKIHDAVLTTIDKNVLHTTRDYGKYFELVSKVSA